jgi:hypothetical protein
VALQILQREFAALESLYNPHSPALGASKASIIQHPDSPTCCTVGELCAPNMFLHTRSHTHSTVPLEIFTQHAFITHAVSLTVNDTILHFQPINLSVGPVTLCDTHAATR